jgi:hypothetical protein
MVAEAQTVRGRGADLDLATVPAPALIGVRHGPAKTAIAAPNAAARARRATMTTAVAPIVRASEIEKISRAKQSRPKRTASQAISRQSDGLRKRTHNLKPPGPPCCRIAAAREAFPFPAAGDSRRTDCA